jgi:hypothetical protein
MENHRRAMAEEEEEKVDNKSGMHALQTLIKES